MAASDGDLVQGDVALGPGNVQGTGRGSHGGGVDDRSVARCSRHIHGVIRYAHGTGAFQWSSQTVSAVGLRRLTPKLLADSG